MRPQAAAPGQVAGAAHARGPPVPPPQAALRREAGARRVTLTATSTLTDVAFVVCTALAERGFIAVLTGGSAATFHAPDAYVSRDLDFVLTLRGRLGEEALREVGYERVPVASDTQPVGAQFR